MYVCVGMCVCVCADDLSRECSIESVYDEDPVVLCDIALSFPPIAGAALQRVVFSKQQGQDTAHASLTADGVHTHKLSRKDLFDISLSLAAELMTCKVSPRYVVLWVTTSRELIHGLFACMCAGVIAVPLLADPMSYDIQALLTYLFLSHPNEGIVIVTTQSVLETLPKGQKMKKKFWKMFKGSLLTLCQSRSKVKNLLWDQIVAAVGIVEVWRVCVGGCLCLCVCVRVCVCVSVCACACVCL